MKCDAQLTDGVCLLWRRILCLLWDIGIRHISTIKTFAALETSCFNVDFFLEKLSCSGKMS